jgi:hypothetical protein
MSSCLNATVIFEPTQYIAPASALGALTGQCSFHGNEQLIAMKCYFDGSNTTDENGDQWAILAGFSGQDGEWAAFEKQWSEMLRARYPIAPYIHMSQILAREDPFERVAGWTDDKILQLVSDALDIVDGMTKRTFGSICCRVNLSARNRIVSEGKSVHEPMSLCGMMCGAIGMARVAHRPQLSFFFFDRGEEFVQPFKREWLLNRTPPGKISIDPNKAVWDLIGNIQETDMQNNPPLQAADMIAWAINRELSGKDKLLTDLANRIRAIVSHDNAEIGEQILREKYIISSPSSV